MPPPPPPPTIAVEKGPGKRGLAPHAVISASIAQSATAVVCERAPVQPPRRNVRTTLASTTAGRSRGCPIPEKWRKDAACGGRSRSQITKFGLGLFSLRLHRGRYAQPNCVDPFCYRLCLSRHIRRGGASANLPLTCSTANAIGEPQDNCSGDWAYESPTPNSSSCSRGLRQLPWIRASNLTSSDTVNVCTLPVEPETYSTAEMRRACGATLSCPRVSYFPIRRRRPASGAGGSSPGSIAVVAATGGRYADPLAAAANAEQGDAWCRREGADPARFPCVISIAPGVYELASTLIVPAHVAVIGYGPGTTVLTASTGVAVTVQLGFAQSDPILGSALRDLPSKTSLAPAELRWRWASSVLGALTSTTFAQPRRAGARISASATEGTGRRVFQPTRSRGDGR